LGIFTGPSPAETLFPRSMKVNVDWMGDDKVLYGTVPLLFSSLALFANAEFSRYSTFPLEVSMSAAHGTNVHGIPDTSWADGLHEVPGALVQETLAGIFQSAPFRASKQLQHLLQYIVDQSLAGHGSSLKERLIGVNVFGRRPDYDTNEDPIVRARVGEVRKRLAQFYLGEGSQSAVRIEISPGAYHATFTELQPGPPTPPPESISSPAEPEKEKFPHLGAVEDVHGAAHTVRAKRLTVWVTLLACATFGVAFAFLNPFRTASAMDVFWKPFVDGPNRVLIYSGANPVYMLSANFVDRYEATHPMDLLEHQGHEFVVPISPDLKLKAGDLIAYKNQFITLGDLNANVRVTSFLTMHRQQFDLRSGSDVAFSDLSQSPTILIGGFNNSLTMELTGDLPYVFDRGLTIRNQTNKTQVWSPTFSQDGTATVDYAIVTRTPHSKTGEALVTIAGITQSGTRAAAEFITRPEMIRALIKSAPKGWENKNMEIVLQTKVVNGIPTNSSLVASRYW